MLVYQLHDQGLDPLDHGTLLVIDQGEAKFMQAGVNLYFFLLGDIPVQGDLTKFTDCRPCF